ncbi:MAG: phage tail protein [Armatimonadota bacterium]|nr:phage tail protein [Armatimonadota bacterium]
MTTFGVISEGPTDQEVLRNLLYGLFDCEKDDITELQPLRDATSGEAGQGDWYHVLEYCGSSRFRQAFGSVHYIIVQIDTDCSEEKHYEVPHREGERELTPDELVDRVSDALIARIGDEFYQKHRERILFAISVHSIECWLLPLYYLNAPAKSGKTTGCLPTLNQALSKKFSFEINAKRLDYYRKASDDFADRRKFEKAYPLNPSLKRFVEELKSRHIKMDE